MKMKKTIYTNTDMKVARNSVTEENKEPKGGKASCTDIRKFAELVSRAVSEELGGAYQVKLQEVIKNNGIVLQGLIILGEDCNLSPTIYLNSFLEAFENDIPLMDIVARILDIYKREVPTNNVDLSFFRDFEKVKEGICYKVISKERNRQLLDRIPHIDFLDLSICFYYAYRSEELGDGSILIYNNHLEYWQCTIEELMILARDNTPRIFPEKMTNMGTVLDELMGKGPGGEPTKLPMYVLSNEQRVFGAVCLIYPEVLEKAGKYLGEDFYVLPSSVHEVILLPVCAATTPAAMRDMVREINLTQVAPEEVLSDNLYFYNCSAKRVEVIYT